VQGESDGQRSESWLCISEGPRGKSLRGRRAVTIATAGAIEEYDLKSYPMIMEALAHHTDRVGATIKYGATGRPWRA
jgi:hypothetical protein